MSSRQPRTIDRRTMIGAQVKCLTCCITAKLGKLEIDVQDADTWVPVWRAQVVNGQAMMGLAIEPVCMIHLTVSEQTAVDRGELAEAGPKGLAEALEAMRRAAG